MLFFDSEIENTKTNLAKTCNFFSLVELGLLIGAISPIILASYVATDSVRLFRRSDEDMMKLAKFCSLSFPLLIPAFVVTTSIALPLLILSFLIKSLACIGAMTMDYFSSEEDAVQEEAGAIHFGY